MQQRTVRNASKADAPHLANVFYEAYRLTESWSTIFPVVDENEYVDVQTDLCLEYFSSPTDLVIVAEDEEGTIVGGMFGRVLTEEKPDLETPASMAGKNMDVVSLMDSSDFINGLLRKYGKIFCKSEPPREKDKRART